MPADLEELVGFIVNPKPQVRLSATENLVPYSTSQPSIFKVDDLQPVKNLKLLVKDQPKIAEHVVTSLVNLSADQEVLKSLATDDKFLETILSYITDPDEANADLLSMLLANLAKWDGLKSILEMKQPAPEGLGSDDLVVNQLLDLFVKGADGAYNKNANFDHLSYLFADLTKHAEIRHHFYRKQEYDGVIPLTKLNVFTEHKSKIRRKGVASIIKNCAFDIPSHPAFMAEDDINMLPYILLPIIGNEEYDLDDTMDMLPDLQLLPADKERESDPTIVQTHMETLLLLASTREGREYMRKIKVYAIVKENHLKVNDPGVQEACERLVDFLMRDEEDETDEARAEEAGSEDKADSVEESDDDDEITEV